ncbi:e3 ubiquitin-protein ligase rbbp6 [Anaeramoeba flamelloides]|uniref:E3 ubiquitin-protein ligase rbbp6 n=1 Tax=Anaeramoeba flamelloides TaxID=1746091 RepID=A0ABQ8XPB2_9EUKA|nr:e3 ubiquitin-protein ligase rbbp6 [Anaeramoeba flamelloides]
MKNSFHLRCIHFPINGKNNIKRNNSLNWAQSLIKLYDGKLKVLNQNKSINEFPLTICKLVQIHELFSKRLQKGINKYYYGIKRKMISWYVYHCQFLNGDYLLIKFPSQEIVKKFKHSLQHYQLIGEELQEAIFNSNEFKIQFHMKKNETMYDGTIFLNYELVRISGFEIIPKNDTDEGEQQKKEDQKKENKFHKFKSKIMKKDKKKSNDNFDSGKVDDNDNDTGDDLELRDMKKNFDNEKKLRESLKKIQLFESKKNENVLKLMSKKGKRFYLTFRNEDQKTNFMQIYKRLIGFNLIEKKNLAQKVFLVQYNLFKAGQSEKIQILTNGTITLTLNICIIKIGVRESKQYKYRNGIKIIENDQENSIILQLGKKSKYIISFTNLKKKQKFYLLIEKYAKSINKNNSNIIEINKKGKKEKDLKRGTKKKKERKRKNGSKKKIERVKEESGGKVNKQEKDQKTIKKDQKTIKKDQKTIKKAQKLLQRINTMKNDNQVFSATQLNLDFEPMNKIYGIIENGKVSLTTPDNQIYELNLNKINLHRKKDLNLITKIYCKDNKFEIFIKFNTEREIETLLKLIHKEKNKLRKNDEENTSEKESQSSSDKESRSENEIDSQSEIKARPESETKSESQSETKSESEPESGSGSGSEHGSGSDTESSGSGKESQLTKKRKFLITQITDSKTDSIIKGEILISDNDQITIQLGDKTKVFNADQRINFAKNTENPKCARITIANESFIIQLETENDRIALEHQIKMLTVKNMKQQTDESYSSDEHSSSTYSSSDGNSNVEQEPDSETVPQSISNGKSHSESEHSSGSGEGSNSDSDEKSQKENKQNKISFPILFEISKNEKIEAKLIMSYNNSTLKIKTKKKVLLKCPIDLNLRVRSHPEKAAIFKISVDKTKNFIIQLKKENDEIKFQNVCKEIKRNNFPSHEIKIISKSKKKGKVKEKGILIIETTGIKIINKETKKENFWSFKQLILRTKKDLMVQLKKDDKIFTVKCKNKNDVNSITEYYQKQRSIVKKISKKSHKKKNSSSD